ncbi:MAG: sulfatase-like hydrolase/transferase [Bacteroidetes bacterium]|nr:sulfatase-like hydrolase/transferase [Bacteroidota bacterium]
MKILQKLPTNVNIILKQYILSLIIYFIFRVILFATEIDRIDNDVRIIDILHSFLLGFRFDLVVSSYILILPFLLMSINAIAGKDFKPIRKFVFLWCSIISVATFLVSAIDIPFFNHFLVRLTHSSFDALKDGNAGWILSMISEETRYWIFFAIFLLISALYVLISNKIIIKSPNKDDNKIIKTRNYFANVLLNIAVFLLGFTLIFFGIRGRFTEKSPIRIGTAYFCNNNFLNQLGLNPSFTLLASALENSKNKNKNNNFMNDDEAIKNIQHILNLDTNTNNITRNNDPITDIYSNRNVILIIMEGMSAGKMKRYGNNKNLTPFLDSIANIGLKPDNNATITYTFDNTFSTSVKTFGGVFCTLFSYPIARGNNIMKIVPILQFDGLSTILKSQNYSTIYFTTHDGQFDGIAGFLYNNNFEKVVELSDYPLNEAKTTMGVPDDFMFRFSHLYLNELHRKERPFFATFLTGSDHLPYYIPKYFKPNNNEIKYQATEYADWSLRLFMQEAQKQQWYNNTLFIFAADHGTAIDATYPMSITHYHIPFIIFIPNAKEQQNEQLSDSIFTNIASQVDIAPTILSLLGINYQNSSLGLNLFKEHRKYAVMDATDDYAVISKNYLMIAKNNEEKQLFYYLNKDKNNYATAKQNVVAEMDLYARSYFQVLDYTLRKKKNQLYNRKTDL